MKVLVLGGGVVGITTAYYLVKAGHDVEVIERQEGAGLETSFANGGQVSASHAEPWANPGTPLRALKWLGKADAPLLFHPRIDPALWGWIIRFLRNCTHTQASRNLERTLRVAMYSRESFAELREELAFDYDLKTRGILHFYRNRTDLTQAKHAAAEMAALGLEQEFLDAEGCVAVEPALASARGLIAGGLYSPLDESGDAHKFTDRLAQVCAEKGACFRYGASIRQLLSKGGHITGVETDSGEIREGDAFVMSLGSYSPLLLAPLGIKIPVYPAKGYSITIPVKEGGIAPETSLTDDENKLVFSRLGDRLRVAGTAEFAGYDTSMNDTRAEGILNKAMALFPECGNADKVEFWTGLRPLTPDSVPVIGRTPYDNLYLNTGHGTLGWTMSCGSGRMIADLISGKKSAIPFDGLGMDRF
ncbi:MAG: D-amino acid dehydrogenase [Rhodospirillales bacterium]|nr:D-amino acid dehydrogenase [Rhodospirillales bacterium]